MPSHPWTAVLLLALAAAALPHAGAHRPAEVAYVSFPVSAGPECAGTVNVNGACFAIDPTERSVTVTIVDDAFGPVGGNVSDITAEHAHIVDVSFCGSITIDLPPGSNYLKVAVLTSTPLSSPPCGTSTATKGTIYATFHDEE